MCSPRHLLCMQIGWARLGPSVAKILASPTNNCEKQCSRACYALFLSGFRSQRVSRTYQSTYSASLGSWTAFGSSQAAPAALLLLLFGRASTEILRGVFTWWGGKFLALSHGYGQRIQGVSSCALRRAENADHQVTVVWKFQFGTPFTTAIRRLRRR